MTQPRLLHIAATNPDPRVWHAAFIDALQRLGSLTVIRNGQALGSGEIADRVRECTIYLSSWGSVALPDSLAVDRGSLEYVCHVNGTIRKFIPESLIEAGLPVTNWGDALARDVAEGAVTLLLSCSKDLPRRIDHIRAGGWREDGRYRGWQLEGLRLGLYGCGRIGRAFVELISPFRPCMLAYDPYCDALPEGVRRVDSLEELFGNADAIAIHAGLSEETRNTVTAALLAMLPDHGVIVNTSRGAIVDQQALFAELASGRLRAGLDVLEPDYLAPDHPARQWPNVIFGAHDIGNPRPWPATLMRMHRHCLDNIRRHLDGRPKRFVMDARRLARST
jgi:phosphoglycerate dehydrogenase-like enzyme